MRSCARTNDDDDDDSGDLLDVLKLVWPVDYFNFSTSVFCAVNFIVGDKFLSRISLQCISFEGGDRTAYMGKCVVIVDEKNFMDLYKRVLLSIAL